MKTPVAPCSSRRRRLRPLVITLAVLVTLRSAVAGEVWQELTPATKPSARMGHTMTAVAGGVYVFGGETDPHVKQAEADNDLWRWNNGQGTWDEIPPTTNRPAARAYHAATSAGGKLYILGGVDANNLPLKEVWGYDPSQNTWQQQPYSASLPPKYEVGLAAASPTALYFYGGRASPSNLTDPNVWKYNPANGATSVITYNPEGARVGHCVAWWSNRLYVVGGFEAGNSPVPWVQYYEPNEYMWQEVTPHSPEPPKRAYAAYVADTAAGASNFCIFVAGGADTNGTALADTWTFDAEQQAWTRRADLPLALTRAQAARLPDGRVLLFGGQDTKGGRSDRTFIYGEPDITPGHISLRVLPSGAVELKWGGLSNQVYTVHYSTNLPAGFAILQTNITALNPTSASVEITFTDPDSREPLSKPSQRLYRVSTQK